MQITIDHLSKTYRGKVQALKDVTLDIHTGMFGLLGPNGAGKTTLMSILATLVKPSGGRALVDGFDVTDARGKWAVKRVLGYLPQELGLYPDLNPYEFLDYIATLRVSTVMRSASTRWRGCSSLPALPLWRDAASKCSRAA